MADGAGQLLQLPRSPTTPCKPEEPSLSSSSSCPSSPTAGQQEEAPPSTSTFYPYEVLRKSSGLPLPADVDPQRREAFLSEQDFERLFKTSKQEFARLVKWKQRQEKEKLDLF